MEQRQDAKQPDRHSPDSQIQKIGSSDPGLIQEHDQAAQRGRLFTGLNLWRHRISVAVAVASFWFSGCLVPGDGSADASGAISKINSALNAGDCSTAIIESEKVYHSSATSNEIRRLRAAAHGCRTGIGFFERLNELAQADLTTAGPWRAITLMFPSVATDNKAESAFFASDALLAWLKNDVVVFDPFRLLSDPYNPGSLKMADLTTDANIYLVLISMATIGTLHQRYGNPDALGAPQQTLPWSTLSAIDDVGCGYASALLTLSDSLAQVGASVSQLSGITTAMTVASAGFDVGCQAGCTACGVSCSSCPSVLRHRSVCSRATPTTVDVEACAAAGLIGNVMNSALVGWR
ncbi:MAG: hypothetical protein RJB38_399 [Pseudomonadota bacterium]